MMIRKGKKRKILIIITTAFVPFGGLTTVMMNYYRAIDREAFHIDFASTNEDIDQGLLLELEQNDSGYYCLGDRKKRPANYISKLCNLIQTNKYDVIHINSNSATAAIELAIAKKCKIPIRIVHNHTSICDHQFLHRIMYPLFKGLYTDAIACSQRAGEWIFKDGNFTVLCNGINTERFRYDEGKRRRIREKYRISDQSLVLGHVGKIYKPKNHPFLIEVFHEYHKENPDALLMLVGDGEMRPQIEQQVKVLHLEGSVIFAGMQRSIDEYLSAMDIFLFPSIWEGMPLSMIEAQASGVYCIASNQIDSTVNVTHEVKMLPIDNGVGVWIDALNMFEGYDRNQKSQRDIEMIRKENYDSVLNVCELERIYMGD